MYKITIEQGYNEVNFEAKDFREAELLMETVLGMADGGTKVSIMNTRETEAMALRIKVEQLHRENERLANELNECRRAHDGNRKN